MPAIIGMKKHLSHCVREDKTQMNSKRHSGRQRTAVTTLKCPFQEMAKELGAWIPGCQQ